MRTQIYSNGWTRVFLAIIMAFILCQAAQGADLHALERTTAPVADNSDRAARAVPELPARGTSMQQVRARLGAPLRAHAAVGKPPITRWDYSNYSLYFEHNLLLDAVIPGQPVPLVHEDQLR